MRGYPALLDDDDSVSLRVLTNADLQQRVMRGGVRRLLLLTAAPSPRDVRAALDQAGRLALAGSGVDLDELVTACRVVAVDRVMDDHGELPWDADGVRRAAARPSGATRRASPPTRWRRWRRSSAASTRVRRGWSGSSRRPCERSADDVRRHLDRLVRPGFVATAGSRRLARRAPLRAGHRVPAGPPGRGHRPRPPPDGRGASRSSSATGRCCAAAGRGRAGPSWSTSAGCSRSCGSACSPNRSASTAPSAPSASANASTSSADRTRSARAAGCENCTRSAQCGRTRNCTWPAECGVVRDSHQIRGVRLGGGPETR